MHVAYNYYDTDTATHKSNYNLYFYTLGKFEDRLKNLFFIYSFVLRTIQLAGEQFKELECIVQDDVI